MTDLERIEAIINENYATGRFTYEGLTSSEIGTYNRHQMFGTMDPDTWDDAEWSIIVD